MLAAPSECVHYDMASLESGDFKDRIAFESSKFTEETKMLEDLVRWHSLSQLTVAHAADCDSTPRFHVRQLTLHVSLVLESHAHGAMLPCPRCSLFAFLQVGTETEEKTRQDIHKKTFEILRPEIQKMRELMDFHDLAINVIKQNVVVRLSSALALAD